MLAFATPAAARERFAETEPPRYEPYPADRLPPVRIGMPEDVELLRAPGAPDWPEALRAELARKARSEWPASGIYGPVYANLGVTLRWPLVTAEAGGRVTLPVVDGLEIPIEGALDLGQRDGPRRVVVLVDASASANAITAFSGEAGVGERIAVLEAERRALEHLVALSADDWLELGVIAFGETTWPIAEPGLSAAGLSDALARFRAGQPRGEGRTDAVCALWLARDWLESTPDGVAREIVVLTDGDTPFSGRFLDCDGEGRARSDEAEAACEARVNATQCPASHRFTRADGSSDMVQLASFARHARGELAVHPLLFEGDRSARLWQQVASRTGGRLVRVPGPEAIELALPALVSSRIRGVKARNATTGVESGELLQPGGERVQGRLALVPGANDVELRVESTRGIAALFRFRIYAAPQQLERWLAELRERNRELALRAEALANESAGARERGRARALDVDPSLPPASPSPSP